jgi:hypothetical protein
MAMDNFPTERMGFLDQKEIIGDGNLTQWGQRQGLKKIIGM